MDSSQPTGSGQMLVPRSASPSTNLIVGLVCLLVGLGLLYIELASSESVFVQMQSSSWPTAQATITSSQVASGTSCGKNGCVTNYVPTVSYTYAVNGTTYTGSQIWFSNGQSTSLGEAGAQQEVSLYSVGSTHPAYYDPSNPSLAVFVNGVSQGALLATGLGVVFLLVGGLFLVRYVRQPKT